MKSEFLVKVDVKTDKNNNRKRKLIGLLLIVVILILIVCFLTKDYSSMFPIIVPALYLASYHKKTDNEYYIKESVLSIDRAPLSIELSLSESIDDMLYSVRYLPAENTDIALSYLEKDNRLVMFLKGEKQILDNDRIVQRIYGTHEIRMYIPLNEAKQISAILFTELKII